MNWEFPAKEALDVVDRALDMLDGVSRKDMLAHLKEEIDDRIDAEEHRG